MLKGRYHQLRAFLQVAKRRGFWLEPYLSLELREEIATRLFRLLWAPFCVLVVLAQVALLFTCGFSQPTRFIPVLSWGIALTLAHFVARRRSALDGITVIVGGLVISTTIAVLTNSVHAPAFWSNILALAVVVPLYGARAGIGLSLWCALCGAGWFLLHHLGWTSGLVYPPSLLAYVFLMGCMLSGIGMMSIPTVLLATALRSSEARRIEAFEARRAEQNAELAFQAVFEQTGTLAVLVAPDGTILKINPSAEVLLGVEGSALIGCNLLGLPWTGVEVVAALAGALKRAANGIERLDAPLTVTQGRRHLQLAVAPVRSLDGNLQSLVVEGLDVTKLLEFQRDLAHARRLEALGQLAGGVAHDFNNMLQAIQGALEQLQSGQVTSPDQLEATETIEQAVLRASGLTRKLLAFGRRDKFETQIIDLETLISEATKLFRRTLGAPIDIRLVFAPEDTLIEGDGAAIEHALVNLMVNARDAMKNGGTVTLQTSVITVDAAWCSEQTFPVSPGRLVMLSITDEGVGMSEAVRSRAFEPFFTTKNVGDGSGLGLAAVHGTMLSHGGGVSVESQLDVGTSFQLYFPLASRKAVSRVPPSGIGFSLRLSGTVLVVDDEPLVLRVTRRYLKVLGVTAVFAHDGAAALALLSSGQQCDCVLTDIVMPKMNGAALIAELRRTRPELPIVVMSGFPAGSDGLAQEVPPGCTWLRKPFGQNELAKALDPFLDGHSSGQVTV